MKTCTVCRRAELVVLLTNRHGVVMCTDCAANCSDGEWWNEMLGVVDKIDVTTLVRPDWMVSADEDFQTYDSYGSSGGLWVHKAFLDYTEKLGFICDNEDDGYDLPIILGHIPAEEAVEQFLKLCHAELQRDLGSY